MAAQDFLQKHAPYTTNLFSIPWEHLDRLGKAYDDPPWSNTPEYHQWATKDFVEEKSKELSEIPYVGNLAAGAFELAAPVLAGGFSPIYDVTQAFGKYEDDPEKYEVNNKWDKINAYFPDLEGTTVSGILNAIDMEEPLSAAYNRMIGAAKPTYNRIMRTMRDKRATRQGINKVGMQRRIQEAQAQRAAANQVQQNIQTYGSGDRPSTGMNVAGGGYGQSPTGGDVAGTPFSRGGILGAF